MPTETIEAPKSTTRQPPKRPDYTPDAVWCKREELKAMFLNAWIDIVGEGVGRGEFRMELIRLKVRPHCRSIPQVFRAATKEVDTSLAPKNHKAEETEEKPKVKKFLEWPRKLTISTAWNLTHSQWDKALSACRSAIVAGRVVSRRQVRQLLRLSRAPCSERVAVEAFRAASGEAVLDLMAYPEQVWKSHLEVWAGEIRKRREEDKWIPEKEAAPF